ncbi:hypothetical protein HPB52_010648 [Rhipicephalus sanguineus]|uniref:FMN hydroxy acid dehydrogenase domain-containing protein n=1 Tax=Rhipicephalus sanguineus TaxID=34632 RepID=A0A9D4Q6L6_RHISA|nr:hypothetical protein HPB52_010648 [Rhipicephalus sanguineus]
MAECGGPGCDVLCGRRGGLLRKLCWLLVVTFLVGQCGLECLLVFSEYAAFPVATSYSSEQGLAMAFPDVTVCNANPLRRSRLCAAQASLHGRKGAPQKVLERNCAANATYNEPNGGDDELFRQLQVWMAQRYKEERSTVRRLFRLGHQLWDTVAYCRYARRNCTDQMFFTPTFDSHYGNCFCFHCGSAEQKNEEFYRYHAAASPEDGLELVLDAQAHEYLPTTTEMGFVVVVHGHGFRPVLCNDAVFAEPGYVTHISLTMDCLYLCEQDHTRSMCGCENRDLPTTSNRRGAKAYPICEESREECIREVKVVMGLESVEHDCKCHRSCVNVEYHREVSRAALPDSFGTGPDGRKRALARIGIYFARDTYLKVTSVPKYNGGRVVSSIGGINGMYLGVSFFVLFGMFETLVHELPDLTGAYKGRRTLDNCPDLPIRHRGGYFRSRISVPQVPYSRPEQNVWSNHDHVTGSLFGRHERQRHLDFKSLDVRSTLLPGLQREHRGRYKAVTVNDFRLLGLRKLHPVVRSYYESRADQEQTLRENVAAFKRLRLRPSVLVPVDKRSINTTLLEQPVSMPVGIGPTDLQMMANREGEIATAVASQKEGTVMILSAMSSIPLEKVRPNAPQGIFWQELYAFKNRTVTFEIIKRAQHAGINAFVMTLDAPTWGRRIVDERHLFITPPGISLANLQHLGGAHDVRFERMKGCGLTKYMNDFLDPSLSWKDVAWLRSVSKLPVILKGILTAEDAATAVEVGAAAVTVSNHGGRQLDGTPATVRDGVTVLIRLA